MSTVVYTKFSLDRRPEYQIVTSIILEPSRKTFRVEKKGATKEAQLYPHLIYQNYQHLQKHLPYFKFPNCWLEGDTFVSDFIEGEKLDTLLEKSPFEIGQKLFNKYLSVFCASLGEDSDGKTTSDLVRTILKSNKSLHSLDLSTFNVIVKGDDFYLIDYEWVDTKSQAAFTFFRSYLNSQGLGSIKFFKPIIQFFPMEAFLKEEEKFIGKLSSNSNVRPVTHQIYPGPTELLSRTLQNERKLDKCRKDLIKTKKSFSWRITFPLRIPRYTYLWIKRKIASA